MWFPKDNIKILIQVHFTLYHIVFNNFVLPEIQSGV